MRAIGFTGEARHGKDTAANMLADYLRAQGQTVRVTAWANKLKVSAARSLGMPVTATEQECVDFCDWFKEHGILRAFDEAHPMSPEFPHGTTFRLTGREFLEKLGTEGGREVHGPNVWVDLALPAPNDPARIANYAGPIMETPDWHIDTTTRFDSEVKRIREWNGWIIRVERPSVDNGLTAGAHVSRAGIPREQCDATIINDGTLEDLESEVVGAFLELTHPGWRVRAGQRAQT